MKKLYLIRHAKSDWSNPSLDDFDRPLNKRGKKNAPFMGKILHKKGIYPDLIISSPAYRARTTALKSFKENKIKVLVATDIAARGINIELLPHVVNYELPNVPEDYVHRIGRTGRAGNEGVAMSLVCGEEVEYLEDIEELIKKKIEVEDIEGFTLPFLKKVKIEKKQNNSRQKNNKRSQRQDSQRTKHSKNDNQKKKTKSPEKKDKKDFKKEVEDFIEKRKSSAPKRNPNRKINSDYRRGSGSRNK